MSDEELEATLHRNQVEQVDAKIQEWSQYVNNIIFIFLIYFKIRKIYYYL